MDPLLSMLPIAVLVVALAVFGLPAWCAALTAFLVGAVEAVCISGLSPGVVMQHAAGGAKRAPPRPVKRLRKKF